MWPIFLFLTVIFNIEVQFSTYNCWSLMRSLLLHSYFILRLQSQKQFRRFFTDKAPVSFIALQRNFPCVLTHGGDIHQLLSRPSDERSIHFFIQIPSECINRFSILLFRCKTRCIEHNAGISRFNSMVGMCVT